MARSNKKSSSVKQASSNRDISQRISSEHHQQSISKLFSSQQKSSSPFQPPTTPTNKRKRLENYHHEYQHSSPGNPVSTASMYNFASRPAAHGVIDLTSPNGSPRKQQRRISVGAKVENAPSPHGPKRLAVKNFRTTAKSDSSQFVDKTTKQLDEALTSIFSDRRPALSNEELYKGCENLCRLGRAPELARILKDRCKEHVSATLKDPLLEGAHGKNITVLRAVLTAWSKWMKQVNTIRGIFFYLDRSHLLQTQNPTIHDFSMSLVRTHIFEDPSLQGKIVEGACDLLLSDRIGISSERALFADTVKMFHELGIYTDDFEPRMLALSQTYIADWSDKECLEKALPDYVSSSVKLMASEMQRCSDFDLNQTTRSALLTLLEDHTIQRKEAELTNEDAVADELDRNTRTATDSMKALFEMLQRRRLGAKLKAPFSKWINDTGTAIVFDEKEQEKMVIRLLEFKQKIDHIWRFAFLKHEELGHALRSSFEAFMNKTKKTTTAWNTDNSRTGEMIAKYVDMLLKAGAKAIPSSLKIADGVRPARAFKRFDEDNGPDETGEADEDTEVDNQLDQVLDLFRFVHGKAVFEAFYKKDLARRLLMGRSASHDAEKNMLSRLKTECGAGFTHNLEQMFKDIELAEEEAKAYRNRFSEPSSKSGTIDLTVNILSSAAWPTYPDAAIAIPSDIQACIADFERFYYMKHSGRKLTWKHGLAHCQMKADFPKGKKDLVVSSFQAIILMLFNGIPDDQHLSYLHIKSSTNMNDADCQRTLQSLACAKLRPLTKHPKGREVFPTDTFSLNASFSDPRSRLKINQIQLKETKEENQETHVRVAADRQFETQAAIVRLMKTKKRLPHQSLIAEVIQATRTRGVLQPAEIKKEIDKLVEKEYLERVEGGVYEYLA